MRIFRLLTVLLLSVPIVKADTIAISDPVQVGNQSFTGGSLGQQFTVNSTITVTQLGVFVSGQTPTLLNQLFVAILDNTTQHELAGIVINSLAQGSLVGGDVLVTLTTPLVLSPGNYTVAADGFSTHQLNGDSGCNGVAANGSCTGGSVSAPTENTGGGAISFGIATYSSGPLFPTIPAPGNFFNAGTFAFVPSGNSPVPEPSSFILLSTGLASGIGVLRRKFIANS